MHATDSRARVCLDFEGTLHRPNIFRQLALATALADGIPEREIARRFAEEWNIQRDSVHVMIKKLIASWASQEPTKYRSLSPWKTSAKARERMNVLRAALAEGQARGDVVCRYAEEWELSSDWVDELITRVLDEDQHELIAESETQRLRYIARVRAHLARSAELRDYSPTSRAYERLILIDKD